MAFPISVLIGGQTKRIVNPKTLMRLRDNSELNTLLFPDFKTKKLKRIGLNRLWKDLSQNYQLRHMS